jgi:hypothetical protein
VIDTSFSCHQHRGTYIRSSADPDRKADSEKVNGTLLELPVAPAIVL